MRCDTLGLHYFQCDFAVITESFTQYPQSYPQQKPFIPLGLPIYPHKNAVGFPRFLADIHTLLGILQSVFMSVFLQTITVCSNYLQTGFHRSQRWSFSSAGMVA